MSKDVNEAKLEILALISKLYPDILLANISEKVVQGEYYWISIPQHNIEFIYKEDTGNYLLLEYFSEGSESYTAKTLLGVVIKWINTSEEYFRKELDKILKLKEKLVGMEISYDTDYEI